VEELNNKSLAWALPKAAVLATVIIGLLGFQRVEAQGVGNPLIGYDASTDYFLDYSSGNFNPGNSSDVQVNVSVDGGAFHSLDVDTGSRGLYESSDALPATIISDATGPTYLGTIDLSSSGRVYTGVWVPTTETLPVNIQQNGVTTVAGTTITSSANILDVTTLSAQAQGNRTATFGVTANAPVGSSLVLTDGGTVTVSSGGGSSANYVSLTGTQAISYAQNPGKIADVSNFGIGFDLSGAPGGTGPVGNNVNQITNVLININPTVSGTYVQGYVITTNGIQLGLTSANTGYAYTSLNTTKLASTNSQPDWQTPLGQTTVNGTINKAGSIVMDSGIPDAFISAPGLSGTLTQLSVSLINSGGAVGYQIDLSGTSELNPQPDSGNNAAAILVVAPTTDGTFSQNKTPYQAQFFNTGRNVFEGFDMLYDAQDGYMGLLPTTYGDSLIASDDLSFTAGYYADPIPESQSTAIVLAGLVVYLFRSLKRTRYCRKHGLEWENLPTECECCKGLIGLNHCQTQSPPG